QQAVVTVTEGDERGGSVVRHQPARMPDPTPRVKPAGAGVGHAGVMGGSETERCGPRGAPGDRAVVRTRGEPARAPFDGPAPATGPRPIRRARSRSRVAGMPPE